MRSEAQKRANRKWDSNNMAVLCCNVRKDVADEFKELCEWEGITPNACLKRFVLNYIEEHRDNH